MERGVIFVDLSLAQIASLGAALAVWQGAEPGDPSGYWMSLGFTLVGALIFAVVKGHGARIPQEAIIGISYAVASAAVILTLSQATGEAEHLRDMLVGNILSVQWPEVWLTAAIYVAIAVFHYIFRRRFLDISIDPAGAAARGVSVRFWDFLFYASFGLVVTRSVAIAGVLLVFCYLIVPSVGGMLFSGRIGPRLAVGWVMGTVVSMLGMYFSVLFDLPTGATIVCTFGLALIVMALLRGRWSADARLLPRHGNAGAVDQAAHVGRKGRLHLQRLPCLRMRKRHSPGMERLAGSPLLARSVDDVTHDRMPERGQMDAYLMCPPGHQAAPDQRDTVGGGQHFVFRAAVLAGRIDDDPATVLGAAGQWRDDRAGRRHWSAVNNREVFLLHPARDGVTLHAGVHVGAEGDEHDARGIPVEASDDARLPVTGEQPVQQRRGPVLVRRVDHHARRFVDGHNLVVFIQDGKVHLFRLRARPPRTLLDRARDR